MLIEKVFVNASPLISLFRANLHPLLPRLFPEVLVPDAVWAEVVNRTRTAAAARPTNAGGGDEYPENAGGCASC